MFIEEFDIFEIGVNILIAITECLPEETLRTQWRSLRNKLAEERQMDPMDDFERWNFYLFYVVKDKSAIDRSLKYEIEHDTVSSRKIIIDRAEFTDGNYDTLIASYIKYDIGELVGEEHKLDFIINKSAQKLTNNED